MEKEQLKEILLKQYPDLVCEKSYWAYAFINVDGKSIVKEGCVFNDTYFVDEKTQQVFPVSMFHMINNVDDFED